jgi:thioredoxin reductase
LFTNSAIKLDTASRVSLMRKGVIIEERPIAKLEGHSPEVLDNVVLSDGGKLGIKALFIATFFRMAAPFATDLGCELIESPRGSIVRTDESKTTSISGVYATGDMARLTRSIPFAVSDGVTAGVSVHQSLVAEEEEKGPSE